MNMDHFPKGPLDRWNMELEEQLKTYKFDNGLEVIYLPEKGTAVGYIGIMVGVGSRDEISREYGSAHAVEHMLFKGTKKRNSLQLIERIEQVGSEVNAYTTKEDTTLYAAFPREYCHRLLQLLCDIALGSTFPEGEWEKERAVILEEIDSYLDSPSEQIFDDFEDLLFSSSGIGHNILGDRAVLQQLSSESLKTFYKKHYSPSNMTIALMGDLPWEDSLGLIARYLGEEPSRQVDRKPFVAAPRPDRLRAVEMDTHQEHLILGGLCYSMYQPERLPMVLLNNILGGAGMNSRLNLALREREGLVYSVESSYTAYSDTGLWSIYFSTSREKLPRAQELVMRELELLRNDPLTPKELESSKRQLLGQILLSREHRESRFLSMLKAYHYHHRIETTSELAARIASLRAEDLQQVAQQLFLPDDLSELRYY